VLSRLRFEAGAVTNWQTGILRECGACLRESTVIEEVFLAADHGLGKVTSRAQAHAIRLKI
jgi:hypothetical protein